MFHNARIKLTVWYLLIIMLISTAFSVVVYKVLTREFERFERLHRFRIERSFRQEFAPPSDFGKRVIIPLDPDLIKDAKNRLVLVLIFINTGILIVSGGLGYLLAGRTLRPIKDMLDEQNRFISDASHELRTPLTSLKTSMEVTLRDKDLSLVQAKKLIAENINDVDRIQSLSDQLLRLAQYEKPNDNMRLEKLNLKKIIEKSFAKINPIAKSKNISIKTIFQDVEIKGHKDSLEDLFVILLDNAVKYSLGGSRIEIQSEKTDGYVRVYLSDRGIGISEKDLPHIFERFYRADTVRTKAGAQGYGLGLSIAKKIAALHRGSIKVKSIVKKGTTFIVQLPRLKS